MKHIRVKWKHANPMLPVLFYRELDNERRAVRTVERFADGRYEFASRDGAVVGASLGEIPIPPVSEIAQDPQFVAAEISAAEFEEAWAKRRPAAKRRRIAIIVVCLVAVGAAVFSLLHLRPKPTHVEDFQHCFSSRSPDGRHECVVTKQRPPTGSDGPHLYSFGIIAFGEHSIGALPGNDLKITTDGSELGIQSIVWDSEGATVLGNSASPGKIARVDIRNGNQYWTDCRLDPSTESAASSRPALRPPQHDAN